MSTTERIWMAINLLAVVVSVAFIPAFIADGYSIESVAALVGVAVMAFLNVITCFLSHLCAWER